MLASGGPILFCLVFVSDGHSFILYVSDGILFSVLPEKSMQKRGAGREIALTREKACRYILRIIVTPVVKERPCGRP